MIRIILPVLYLAFTINAQSSIYKNHIVLNSTLPFTKQILCPRTTYRIISELDCNGDTIMMPPKCELLFDGGSINNGVIIGNQTQLSGNIKCYTHISGTFKNINIETGWFLEPNSNNTICRVLSELINTGFKNIIINKGKYPVSDTVFLRSDLKIYGESGVVFALDRERIKGGFCLFVCMPPKSANKSNNIIITGLTFELNGAYISGSTSIFKFINASNVKINRCAFVDYIKSGDQIASYSNSMIEMFNCSRCSVDNCYTEYVRLVGSYSSNHLTVSNNTGYCSHGTWLECNDGSHNIYKNNSIYGNLLKHNSTISQNSTYGIIRNNTIVVNDTLADSMINLGHPSSNMYSNSPKGCIVEGNYLKSNICKGIVVWGNKATDIIIRDNVIESSGSWSIYTLTGTQRIKIKNNTIFVGKSGLAAINCQSENSSIVNNSISTVEELDDNLVINLSSDATQSCKVYRNTIQILK